MNKNTPACLKVLKMPTIKITKTLAKKVLSIVDCGLSNGLGNPIPGEMCVEAAVNFACGLPHGDKPPCVDLEDLNPLKIALNDKDWSSPQSRAKGLRRLAIAQLGTSRNFDNKLFREKLIHLLRSKTVPSALRFAASIQQEPYKASLLDAAILLESAPTQENVIKARTAAANAASYAANAASYAANAASYAANAASYATNSAANAAAGTPATAANAAYAASYAANAAYAAAYAAKAATTTAAASTAKAAYAADAAADATRDKELAIFAEDITQILIQMKTPGSKYLFLTEENK